MGDLEFFGGADLGGEVDAAAFERFKERMRQAAAQLKALQKSEQKQKKTEDELIKILMRFLKSGKKREIMLLVIRLLEMNVPAGFIVGILTLSNKDIQEELKINLLPAPEEMKEAAAAAPGLTIHMGDQALPLKIKIAMVNWINEITRRVNDNPHRILQTILDEDRKVHNTAIQLATFCLRDFLTQEKQDYEFERLQEFSSFFLNDIMVKAAEEIKNRKELR